jgi:hypothetical protein
VERCRGSQLHEGDVRGGRADGEEVVVLGDAKPPREIFRRRGALGIGERPDERTVGGSIS